LPKPKEAIFEGVYYVPRASDPVVSSLFHPTQIFGHAVALLNELTRELETDSRSAATDTPRVYEGMK